MSDNRTPLVEMRNISISFGGIHAVDDASVDLFPGEVVAIMAPASRR
jgi:D-xylose transport system ATP-binding protein